MTDPVKDKHTRRSAYFTLTEQGVQCLICPHMCVLREGKTGICRTHRASGSELLTMAYGNPCSVHADPVEKKPLFHFLPGSACLSLATAGCNLGCLNCQNWEISQAGPAEIPMYDLLPDQVVEMALERNCSSIAYTYTEPTVYYEYMLDTATLARQRGLRNLMISNGYINEKPLLGLCRFLDGANIDLKSFSDATYRKLFRGTLQPVLDSLVILKESGVWLEITTLIIPGVNDDPAGLAGMCRWLVLNGFSGVPIHFSRFHPMYRMTGVPVTPLSTLDLAGRIAADAGLRYIYAGNVPGSAGEHTYCPSCKRRIIERAGFSVGSLHLNGNECGFCGTRVDGVWA